MAKRAVRVFLDLNVILSGLISLRLPWLAGLTGEYNIIEIERNLARKLPTALPVYKRYVAKLNLKIVPLPSLADIENYRGCIADKDVPVLVSAINGTADYLVTGDNKDFGKIKNSDTWPFKIVTPAEFLDGIAPDILQRTATAE
jgi:predicted nucleic acid-binding protein